MQRRIFGIETEFAIHFSHAAIEKSIEMKENFERNLSKKDLVD